MPKVIICILAILALSGASARPEVRNHQVSWEAHHLDAGTPLRMRSPAGVATLSYDGEARLSLISANRRVIFARPILPPVSALWSGDGRFIALNDGEGSGQTSRLVLLDLAQSRPSADRRPENDLRRAFLRRTQCRSRPASISVRAEGWSSSAPQIWVSFEAWDRERLCEHDDMFFARYDLGSRRIVEVLSRQAAYARFCRDPGFARRFASQCRTV